MIYIRIIFHKKYSIASTVVGHGQFVSGSPKQKRSGGHSFTYFIWSSRARAMVSLGSSFIAVLRLLTASLSCPVAW